MKQWSTEYCARLAEMASCIRRTGFTEPGWRCAPRYGMVVTMTGHESVLPTALRARPRTVAELATLARLGLEETTVEVARLVAEGVLVLEDGVLGYPSTIDRAAEAISATADRLRQDILQLTGSLDAIAGELPSLGRDWSIGEFHDLALSSRIIHGERAAEDLWRSLSADQPREAPVCVVFPDMSPFLVRDPERARLFAEATAGRAAVRALLPLQIREKRFEPVLQTYPAIRIRTRDHLSGWFWVDGDFVTIPLDPDSTWPSSVRLLKDRALAATFRAHFDLLWESAQDVVPTGHEWDPLLDLMMRGRTLESASRLLGIHPRTGRRRAAAAMEHFGVDTLFALGVAWGRRPT